MENWVLASENYRDALRRDVYCYEAFELLMKHQMLTAEEGKRTSQDTNSGCVLLFVCMFWFAFCFVLFFAKLGLWESSKTSTDPPPPHLTLILIFANGRPYAHTDSSPKIGSFHYVFPFAYQAASTKNNV